MEREGRGTTQTRGGSGRPFGDSDFVLQWGNRKRLRCVKIQVKSPEKASAAAAATTVRVDRRVVTSDKEPSTATLRRPSHSHRILRNSEAMRSPQRQLNGRMTWAVEGQKKGEEDDGKKGGLPMGGDCATAWPRFEITLSNKEKEEDFMIFKGCNKLPQRPKKRAKCIQRTVNLVCPGTWLCDLTQERYEVREKKVSKKRPRGLKAMGSMESDSD